MSSVVLFQWVTILALGGFLVVLGCMLLVWLLGHLAVVRSAREGEEDEALAAAVLASVERGELVRIPGLLEESGTPLADILRRVDERQGVSPPTVGGARRLLGGLSLAARLLQGMEFAAVAGAYIATIVLAVCIVIGLRTPRNPELEAAGLSLVVLLVLIPLIARMHHVIKRIRVGHAEVAERRWKLANRIGAAIRPHRPGNPSSK